MFGLTFLALADSAAAEKCWKEEDAARKARLDRQERLFFPHPDVLSEEERDILRDIQEQLAQEKPTESEKACPECRRPFIIVTVHGVDIDCCRFCRGIWFDPGELQYFSHQAKEIPSDDKAHRPSRYLCPVCGTRMVEFVFVNPQTLLVDRCPNGHGVYLEDRELERVFEIV